MLEKKESQMSWAGKKQRRKIDILTAAPANGAFPFSLALTFTEEHCEL